MYEDTRSKAHRADHPGKLVSVGQSPRVTPNIIRGRRDQESKEHISGMHCCIELFGGHRFSHSPSKQIVNAGARRFVTVFRIEERTFDFTPKTYS